MLSKEIAKMDGSNWFGVKVKEKLNHKKKTTSNKQPVLMTSSLKKDIKADLKNCSKEELELTLRLIRFKRQ
jgi:hypothetical protein